MGYVSERNVLEDSRPEADQKKDERASLLSLHQQAILFFVLKGPKKSSTQLWNLKAFFHGHLHGHFTWTLFRCSKGELRFL